MWRVSPTSLLSLQLTFSSWCGRYVYRDAFTECQTALYSRPVVCDVKLDFYYLCCAVLWELPSYLVLENSLWEWNVVLQLRNGQLIWTDICPRERRGETGKPEAYFVDFSSVLSSVSSFKLELFSSLCHPQITWVGLYQLIVCLLFLCFYVKSFLFCLVSTS